MTDHNASVATNQLRRDIAAALDQDTVDADAYLDGAYLEAAFSAGFEVADLARAHDVSKKTIYRSMDRHDLKHETPPKNGPARRLWDSHPDTVPGDD